MTSPAPPKANEMTESEGGHSEHAPALDWREALEALEQSLKNAGWAAMMLRRALEEAAAPAPPAPRPVHRFEQEAFAVETPAPPRPAPREPAEDISERPLARLARAEGGAGAGGSPFERLWDRLEHERRQKAAEEHAKADAPPKRGLDALPQQYLVTVEDRESKVDLVPLHRALSALPGIDEVSLVSFANAVPVISLRTEGELDMDLLVETVSVAMDRACELIRQDSGRLFLRLRQSEEGAA